MEKKIIKIEENQVIEIDGAILTPQVIKQIKIFQDGNNECIDQFREYMADAICFIAKESADYSGIDKVAFKENAHSLISDLAYCRDYLKILEKPFEILNPQN